MPNTNRRATSSCGRTGAPNTRNGIAPIATNDGAGRKIKLNDQCLKLNTLAVSFVLVRGARSRRGFPMSSTSEKLLSRLSDVSPRGHVAAQIVATLGLSLGAQFEQRTPYGGARRFHRRRPLLNIRNVIDALDLGSLMLVKVLASITQRKAIVVGARQ